MSTSLRFARRTWLGFVFGCLWVGVTGAGFGQEVDQPPLKKMAVLTTVYHHNSHSDVIASRLLQTDTLDGKGKPFQMTLAGLYTDQTPENDISRKLAEQYQFPIFKTPREALTLGGPKLAVDGVLLIAEHGKYPWSDLEQIQYPKRRLFEDVVKVFQDSGRVTPVFIDKHLADDWDDALWIYRTAQDMKIPLMAGSSLPGLWRLPPADVRQGAKVREILVLSYHLLDTYGFHAVEIAQCLAEQRAGGETGVASVETLEGDAVWKAGEEKGYDPELLQAALSRLHRQPRAGRTLQELVKKPVLFRVRYRDGLLVHILTLNGAVGEWSAAWRYAEVPPDASEIESTLFDTQEARPFFHFSFLTRGVEQMMLTGRPAWPVERTLLTSGTLNALLQARKLGRPLDTPHLHLSYPSPSPWRVPPDRPTDRPIHGQ